MLRGSERQRHTRQLHRLKDALARRLETRLPGDANSEAPQGGWEGSEASIPPVPVAAEGDEEPKGSLARQGAAAHLQALSAYVPGVKMVLFLLARFPFL